MDKAYPHIPIPTTYLPPLQLALPVSVFPHRPTSPLSIDMIASYIFFLIPTTTCYQFSSSSSVKFICLLCSPIMGLSSKLVSRDGLDWSQDYLLKSSPKPHAAQVIIRCPRCDSSNTKFCYYNNYSKLQPRHFCKACRRHWTNGGTLRNVPVGGGRKNKRPKTSHQSNPSIASNHVNNSLLFQQQPLASGEILQVSLLQPSPQLPPPLPSDFSIDSGGGGSSIMGSLLLLPPVPQFNSITAGAIDRSNPFSTPAAFFSSFIDFTEQDIPGSIAPWKQLLPSASTNTNSSSNGLQDSSSSFWSCWENLAGLLSPLISNTPSPHDSNSINGESHFISPQIPF